jgi:hypothetical protein
VCVLEILARRAPIAPGWKTLAELQRREEQRSRCDFVGGSSERGKGNVLSEHARPSIEALRVQYVLCTVSLCQQLCTLDRVVVVVLVAESEGLQQRRYKGVGDGLEEACRCQG